MTNAHEFAQKNHPRTVGELMAYLEQMKAIWAAEDVEYLGRFEDQTLYAYVPGGGIAHAFAEYCGEFGLVLYPLTNEPR